MDTRTEAGIEQSFEEKAKRHRIWGPALWGVNLLGVLLGVITGLIVVVGLFVVKAQPEDSDGAKATASPTNTALPDPSSSATPWASHWSPVRQLYSDGATANKPVLNSVVDNPAIGPEYSFLQVRHDDPTDTTAWDNTVEVEEGDVMQVRMTINNDADPGLGDAGTVHGLVTHMEFNESDTQTLVRTWVEGSNADVVACDILVKHPRGVSIEFERDSAILANKHGYQVLPNDFANEGWTKLGSDGPDGDLEAGETNSAYVYFNLWAVDGPDP